MSKNNNHSSKRARNETEKPCKLQQDYHSEFSDIFGSEFLESVKQPEQEFSDIVEDDEKEVIFHCPCCGFTSQSHLFEPGWQLRLFELCHAKKGHGVVYEDVIKRPIEEQKGTFHFLLNYVEDDGGSVDG